MMAAPLLTTKLYIPSPRFGLVPRPRLVERLNAGLRGACKLMLISSPPGFGKTTLLAEWIYSARVEPASPSRFAWISCDENDNDPARWATYLVAALQTAEPGIGESALSALSALRTPFESFMTQLINELALVQADVVLILDDYHLITVQPIHDALDFILDHAPPNFHLVVATRADPPVRVARLRARGQLLELRQTDLRFTPDEAVSFFSQTAALKLAARDMAALADRTEGWVAGLQMAALAMQGTSAAPSGGDPAEFVAAFTGSQHYVLDYLIEEVFQRQPESVQSFLLQTSILDRMCGSLCDAVIGSPLLAGEGASQAMLDRLEHANLFVIPLDDQQCWYRYHRLFGDLLRKRLHQTRADLVPALHRRASEWFELQAAAGDEDLTNGAIEHAASAHDDARAARLIEQAAPAILARSEIATLLRWLGLLPVEAARARPRLRIFQAMGLLLSGQSPDAVETILGEVEQAGPGAESGALGGEVMALRALSAAYQGNAPRAAQLARQALELLPEDNLLLRGFAMGSLGLSYLWAEDLDAAVRLFEQGARIGEKVGNVMFAVIVLRRVGRLRMAQGRLYEAKAIFDHALEIAVDRRGRRLPVAGLVLTGLGYLAYEWNDLETASRYLAEGIELAQGASAAMTIGAHLALARLRRAQGDPAGAREALVQAKRLAARTAATDSDDIGVAMDQARSSLDQGDLGSALAWARSRGLDQPLDALVRQAGAESADGLIRRYELPAFARLLLAQERPRDALTLLDLILPRGEREGRVEVVIQVEALRARAFRAMGDSAQALKAVERALALAEPSGYLRLFVDEGEPLRWLIADFALRSADQKLRAYAEKLLAAFGAVSSSRQPRTEIRNPKSEIVEPLTEREREVLRLLAADLSNPEIAEQLYLAVNTVRSHVKSIYGKLGVHSRYEAAIKARELRLV